MKKTLYALKNHKKHNQYAQDDIIDLVAAKEFAKTPLYEDDESTEEVATKRQLQFMMEEDLQPQVEQAPDSPPNKPSATLPRSNRCFDFKEFGLFASSPTKSDKPVPPVAMCSLTPEPEVAATGVIGLLNKFFGTSSDE